MVYRSVDVEYKYYENLARSVGLRYTVLDTRKQQDGLVVAKTVFDLKCKEEYAAYEDYRKDMSKAMGISRSTVGMFIRLLKGKKTVISDLWISFTILAIH